MALKPRRTTRRAAKASLAPPKSKPTTIPELKRSFDALEDSVADILRSGATPGQQVKRFQATWRRIFGRPVDAAAAEAYLEVKSRKGVPAGTSPRKTRRGRGSQRGGATPLAGAPLDFMTRPGIDGVHGSFPQYLTQGLSFYNTINQEGMYKDCGIKDITPQIAADMGSNKFTASGGGSVAAGLHVLGTRPFPASVPTSFAQDLQDMALGRTLGPSPAPDQNSLKFR